MIDGTVLKYDDTPATYQANINTVEAPYDRKLGQAPRLSDDEIEAIVTFLETLSDE